MCYSLWYNAPMTTSWMHYTTSCKHSLVLLRMGAIIARNMLSWLELLISRYCCIYLVVYIILISLYFLRLAKQSQFNPYPENV